MARQPIVITTLQEDLKKIGLYTETDQEAPGPEPDQEGGYTGDSDEEPEDEPDTISEMDEPEDEPAEEPEMDDDDAEEAIEAMGTLARHFLHQHEPLGKPVGAVTESRRRRRQSRYAKAQRSSNPTVRINSLLEEVSDIVGDIHRTRKEEQIKGFANIAVIADKLAGTFSGWGMSLEEGNLYKVGAVMKKLSEDAATMAVRLEQPEGEPEDDDEGDMDEIGPRGGPPEDDDEGDMDEIGPRGGPTDDAEVDALFKKFMAKLLDALQLYHDVTGKEEADEPEDDEDEVDVDVEVDVDEPEDDEGEEDEDEPELDEGDDEDDDEDEPEVEPEEEAIAEARKRLADMKGRLREKKVVKAGKKGKGRKKRVLKGGRAH